MSKQKDDDPMLDLENHRHEPTLESEVQEGTWIIEGAICLHEKECHDGKPCLCERVNAVAHLVYALDFPLSQETFQMVITKLEVLRREESKDKEEE